MCAIRTSKCISKPKFYCRLMIVAIMGLDFCPVDAYAETDFGFASISFFSIIGLLILAAILFSGGVPNHTRSISRCGRIPARPRSISLPARLVACVPCCAAWSTPRSPRMAPFLLLRGYNKSPTLATPATSAPISRDLVALSLLGLPNGLAYFSPGSGP